MLEVKKIAVGSSFTLEKFDQKYRNSITISSIDYKQEYFECYRNFRSITRTADYPHRPIIAYGEKKSQRITRTSG